MLHSHILLGNTTKELEGKTQKDIYSVSLMAAVIYMPVSVKMLVKILATETIRFKLTTHLALAPNDK